MKLSLAVTIVLGLTLLDASAVELVPQDSSWRYFKGTSEASWPDTTAWRLPSFDVSGWTTANEPFWYGDVQPSPGTRLSDMRRSYTCIFMRKEFVVENPNAIAELKLTALSDDGFNAWINGHPVATFNMRGWDLHYNDTSLPALQEPIPWVEHTVSNPRAVLLPGTNILAVQAFNSSIGSSGDFVINVALRASVDETPPYVDLLVPPAGGTVRTLTSIEIGFSEPVVGVDAADLLINDQPATGLRGVGANQFVFDFPQPPTGTVHVAWAPGHGISDTSSASNAFAGGAWSYNLDPNLVISDVYISEFLSSNSGEQPNSIRDELGKSVDWIEIHNAKSTPQNVTGWFLTDDASDLTRWRFPSGIVPARGYLLVFVSGRDTNVLGRLHTNFKLSSNPSFLALVDELTNIVSAFSPTYPRQYEDVSYGRDRLDATLVGYFTQTTPGEPNVSRGEGFGPEVEFSRVGGTFISPFQLKLSVPDANNWEVRYLLVTSNVGSGTPALTNIPTATSPLYVSPIQVNTTVQVRARSFPKQAGFLPGPPRTANYVQLTAQSAAFTSHLPIVLIHNLAGGNIPSTTDQSAIFMTFEPINGVASMTNPPTLVTRAGINIRGNTTEGYAVETWNEYNDDQDVEVCGMPAESDWVFYAPNAFDQVLIHNPMASEMSWAVGRYAPRTRFVEVFLNKTGGAITFNQPASGNYNGLWVVEEKVKRNSARVDIANLQPENTSPPDVTGGYLLLNNGGRVDADERTFTTSRGQQLIYQDPTGIEIQSPDRDPQEQYLRQYFNDFETALFSSSYTNSQTGYAAYIDVNSWIDHHIVNVTTLCLDALRLSAFLYKDREKKIELGPIWDFDRSQGTTGGGDTRAFNPCAWRGRSSDNGTDFFGYDTYMCNAWMNRLFNDLDFWQRWIDRWQELRRNGTLSDASLFALVDALGNVVSGVQTRAVQFRSEIRPRSGTVSANGYSHTFSGTYQGELDFLKLWYRDRCNFIDTNFLAAPVFSGGGGSVPAGFTLTVTAPNAKPGTTTYYTLDGSDPRMPSGAISAAARSGVAPFSIVLEDNARVFARNRNPNHRNLTGPSENPPLSSPWSGSTVATYVVATPALAVTEIMYHPPNPTEGTGDDNDFEFIELKNVGPAPINLVGFGFANGIQFTFTAANSVTSLGAGEYVVLVKNLAAFKQRYPDVTNIGGVYIGNLDNAGERLRLLGPMLELVMDFKFNDSWCPTTDGSGFSLVIADESLPSSAWGNPSSWRPSAAVLGSPGRPDPPAPQIPAVLINEALTHTDPPAVDTVELFNPMSYAVDISGWFLTDDPEEPTKYVFPPGTTIGGLSHWLVDESQFNQGDRAFALSSLGDELFLFSGDGVNLTGYAHGVRFGASANQVPFGRHVDSLGREHFVAQSADSLPGPNSGPKVGPVVLNELMYEPINTGLVHYNNVIHEFIELRNIASDDVPLFDPLHPENTWKLDGGVEFVFPTGLALPARGYLLVVNFNPTIDPVALQVFRQRYTVPSDALIVGPFKGNLANEGERVSLLQPDEPQTAAAPFVGYVPYVLVDDVDFGISSPWPANASGTGQSIQRVSSGAFGDDPANWRAEQPTPGTLNHGAASADADQDGLPDEWETAYGLSADNPHGPDGPQGDPDNDGMSNLAEYQAGTAPNDPLSALVLTYVGAVGDSAVMRFVAVVGRTYSVVASSDLGTGVWVKLVDVPPRADTVEVTVTDNDASGASPRFYKVVTPSQR